jgi:hypothetical protein
MINPDGHQWVEDNDPWWRKTLHDHNENHSVDADEGIDPNRNYDWHWDPGPWSSGTYGGPFPWSAPEVATMRDLHNEHRTAINPTYHSYGEVVLYPFGYGVLAEPAVLDLASEYAGMIGYYAQQSSTAHGSSKDWVYGAIGGAAFTVETATSFIPSGYTMLQVVQQVLPGSIWLTERLWGPSIQGTVTDSIAGIPVEATIHIPEIMNVYGGGELWDMVTEASTGYFCRMRPSTSQTITLEVSAPDYQNKTIQVQTGGTTATVVNIELVPENFDHGILTGIVTNETAGGTPIPGATIALDGEPAFETGANGSYTGYVLPGAYTVTASHPSFDPQSTPGVVIEVGETTVADFSLTDIAGPTISGTTEYPNTSDTLGPYVIETQITDMSALEDLALFYSIAGGAFVEAPLAPTGGNNYEGEIPGQPYTTLVRYYIRATDEGDNVSTDPAGAPEASYSFFVAPVVAVFADELEGGAPGWSHYAVTGGFQDQWHLSTQENHTPGGSWSWKCGDTGTGQYANLLDAGLETPSFTLVDDGRLTFWHWIDAETSGSYPSQAYDGGIVEISVGGGPWEQILPVGGYSHTCRTGGTPGPFPAGTPLFSGTHGWEQVEFDLSAYAGEARVRFRFGSDGSVSGTGWFVDDLEVTGLAIPSAVGDADDTISTALQCTRFRCSPTLLLGDREAHIAYSLTQPANLRLRIYDAEGRQVRSILSAAAAQHGVLQWDGQDAAGRPLGSGLYLMRLESGRQQLASGKVIMLER